MGARAIFVQLWLTLINAFKGLLRFSDRMFNEVEYWLFWNMLQDVLNLLGPIRPATLWGQPWFLLSACAATQQATVCWGNDGQCNISLQFIPVWLWKCKLFEVSKHGKGSKMWGPGSVSKSFLAAWHLRCNEVPWSIRTLALCESHHCINPGASRFPKDTSLKNHPACWPHKAAV